MFKSYREVIPIFVATQMQNSKSDHSANHSPKRGTRLTNLFKEFFNSQQIGGILLIIFTLFSITFANSSNGTEYIAFWKTKIGWKNTDFHLHLSIADWINDALMTVFFLLVGIEIKRELVIGELSDKKKALLPVFAALGGMIFPAIVFLLINFNHPEFIKGAGIPTATDIAFAIAIMGMLGDKVPASLKVFLTALAIIDDLGAIFVIAIFYGSHFSALYITLSAITITILYWLNKKNNNSLWIYMLLGIALWFFMLHSGIHSTLSGVILAFLIPFQHGKQHTISQKLEHALQSPVTYFILPVFALANTAIQFDQPIAETLNSSLGLGIMLGLFLGKPIGIVSFSYLAQKLKIAQIAKNINFIQLLGAGILGGIGFTMAIFVTNLAFDSEMLIANGKIAILFGSLAAAFTGYVLLNFNKKHT